MNLYDYIYVDLEKVISLYSQLTGGVVEIRETQAETKSIFDNKRNYDFKVFKHSAGGTSQDKEIDTITLKPHHSLLQELEQELNSSGHLLDLAKIGPEKTLKSSEVRNTLKGSLCVKCTGRIVIEDYERIKAIGQSFPSIAALINQSHSDSLKNSEEYLELQSKIQDLENASGDRNAKARNKHKAKELRKSLESLLQESSAVEGIPQWILDGLETWIDAFLPRITNIRIYPFPSEADEHLFGNLNSENFSISDSNAFHFTYGSLPTEEFSMLSVVTSVPSEASESFDPLEEFGRENLEDHEHVENAFRGLFRGFDDMESMIRTCRYPRVLVHPILVYRQTFPSAPPN